MKIVTLTLNAAFDIHCRADRLCEGRENLAEVTGEDAGGKGVNISRALLCAGYHSKAVVVLGRDNGNRFADMLRQDGISYIPVWVDGRIRENITVHTLDGKETRISFRGGAVSADVPGRVEKICAGLCDDNTVLTLTGSVPDGISMASVIEFILKMKERGARVVIDSQSFTLEDIVRTSPYLIKPNAEEIRAYIGTEIRDVSEAFAAASELCKRGIENVMISLGELGAVLANKNGAWHASAPLISAVSTIGAGDSSIAGFLYAMSLGAGAEECLRYAVAFGSAACLTEGTKPPRWEDVLRFAADIGEKTVRTADDEN